MIILVLYVATLILKALLCKGSYFSLVTVVPLL